jgi:hypothetical protein
MTEKVEKAVRFLKKVDGKYPCALAIEFLQTQGLTNDEITEAVFSAAAQLTNKTCAA